MRFAPLVKNAAEIFEAILDDIEVAAIERDPGKLQIKFDELRAYIAPFIAPQAGEDWSKFQLSGAEARVANLLHAKMGRPISKSSLLDGIYFDRPNDSPLPKILDVFICRIRKKLKDKNANYAIETVWAQGYKLVELSNAETITAKVAA